MKKGSKEGANYKHANYSRTGVEVVTWRCQSVDTVST